MATCPSRKQGVRVKRMILKKIIRKKRKIEMFPLASMPLSSDSSGNQNTKFIPAIDTPKIKMKTQNAYVRPDAGRGYLGDTRGLVGIRWWWCTKDHKNFKRGVEVLGKNSNEERREKEQGI